MNNRNVLIIAVVAILAIGTALIIYSSNSKKTLTNMALENTDKSNSTTESYSTAPGQDTGKTDLGGEKPISAPTLTPTPSTKPSIPVSPKEMSLDQKLALSKPAMRIDKNKTYSILLKTNMGDIALDLDVKDTPVTSNNFIELAKAGFYNSTIFHRVIKDFMIQGGDPKGNGTGGPSYSFDDESFKCGTETEARKPDYSKATADDICLYNKGLLAMANHGQNTNGSQFFIMHKDTPLPHRYVVFGKVSSGQEIVDKIANVPVEADMTGAQSKPIKEVQILDVIVTEK